MVKIIPYPQNFFRWVRNSLSWKGLRGGSSAGRAPALQAGGHRFDPGPLHLIKSVIANDFATSWPPAFAVGGLFSGHLGAILVHWMATTYRRPKR
jgi:hypothetical protein